MFSHKNCFAYFLEKEIKNACHELQDKLATYFPKQGWEWAHEGVGDEWGGYRGFKGCSENLKKNHQFWREHESDDDNKHDDDDQDLAHHPES